MKFKLHHFRSFDGLEVSSGYLACPDRYSELFSSLSPKREAIIPRGAGLSYGLASAVQGGYSISSRHFNRILAFDPIQGTVSVESGVSVGDLFQWAIRRGWILPVVPGHPAITLGGAAAFDVHGKNHFLMQNLSRWVVALSLFHPKWGELTCSRNENIELFELSLGGMGLTGFITTLTLQLKPLLGQSIERLCVKVSDLYQAAEIMLKYESQYDAMYSWHCLSGQKSIFGAGFLYLEKFSKDKSQKNLPISFKNYKTTEFRLKKKRWAVPILNSWTIGAFSYFKYLTESYRPKTEIDCLERAYFPILGKEIYFTLFGNRGFREYQCLIPFNLWKDTAQAIINLVKTYKIQITMTSLKLFRGQAKWLRYSGEGISLSFNYLMSSSDKKFLQELDRLVISASGRVNLSKDSRIQGEVIQQMFPDYSEFCTLLSKYDPQNYFNSQLRRRFEL